MSMPETNKSVQDMVDIIYEAAQDVEEYVDENTGEVKKRLQLDPEKLYWKSHLINSDKFGRFVLKLKQFQRLAEDAKNNMCLPRAVNLSENMIKVVKGYKYSIDAKSSETLRDKNNTQGTMLHLVGKNKIEKQYSFKDGAKKSLLSGWLGEEDRNDDQ
jgi:hypothetical protein